MFSPFLGKKYDDSEVISAISSFEGQIKVHQCEDVFSEAACAIFSGRIIGWFQGRSECGPRSLGNRSILADPRSQNMKDLINYKVKHREGFRPFAPAVLWEHQTEYFNLHIPSPYMLMVAEIYPDKQHLIPAVTHVDGTGRLQTVLESLTPEFHKLITTFYNMSKIPMILNTSFNVQGEPIVETPEDALRCFVNTSLDEVYLHNYCIQKP